MNQWSRYVEDLRRFAENRPEYLYNNILDHFNLSSTLDLTVESSHGVEGPVKVNSILISPDTPGISQNPYPWTGTYFSGVPVTLTAPEHPAIQFRHWQINDEMVFDAKVEVLPDTVDHVKAIYGEIELADIPTYRIAESEYFFRHWESEEPGGSYPPSMGFVYMDERDPGLEASVGRLVLGGYNLDSRTRINGLGEDGFSFLNTSSAAGNPGYPGTRLGGAVLALNTEGRGSVSVEWTGGTVAPNSRIYHLRLQYRIGSYSATGKMSVIK